MRQVHDKPPSYITKRKLDLAQHTRVVQLCSLIILEPERESLLFTGGRISGDIREQHLIATARLFRDDRRSLKILVRGKDKERPSIARIEPRRSPESLFSFLVINSNKCYIRISQLKLVMKMAHWVSCRLEAFSLFFPFIHLALTGMLTEIHIIHRISNLVVLYIRREL